jgi:hypothetical protein
MSLHVAAQHLKSRGRGPDTELVHMSKNEIKGLQALAMANGGSLTINPDTGLIEAGILEKILPMAAGAALTYFSGGALAPWASALIVGGGYTAATGSVQKGLMAGLGAYGGAGITSSLASAGAETLAEQAGNTAVEGFKQTGEQATKAGLEEATKNAALEGNTLPSNYAEMYNAQTAVPNASNYINAQNFPGLTPEQITSSQAGLPEAVKQGASPEQYMRGLGQASGTQGAGYGTQVAQGLPQIGSVLSNNVGTTLAAATPLLTQDQKNIGPAGYQEDEYDRRLKGFKLSSNYQASEPTRPNPYYQAQYAAGGGLMNSYAPGGPVEQMSQNVTGGTSNMYPQSQQEHTNFATPTQMPTSAEVIQSDYDTKTDPYTGVSTANMASGGIARYASRGQVNVAQDYLDNQQQQMSPLPESIGVPRTGIYRDTDVDTAKKDALSATLIRLNKTRKAAGMKGLELPKTSIKGLGQPDVEEAAAGGTMRYNLGGYSDGGRMLKGPGDGMSDSIPASISGKQPARLADGEFVVPADVVSHLGNGSTDAGAKKLYGMMDKIRKARTGKKKQAPAVKASKFMPA